MMEKLKSVLLALLVGVSLIQSYYLAYQTPKFEPISRGEYVATEMNGTQAKLEDVLFPEQMILHYGAKTHTVLYPMPFLNHYKSIFDFLKQRTFDGLHKTNTYTAHIDWDDIRDNRQGLEIRFREGVPISVLQGFMKITLEDPDSNRDLISRIWLTMEPGRDEVQTFFISDSSETVYEAVKADVTAGDLEVRLRLGESLPKYHTAGGDYYLPNDPLPAIQVTMPYTEFTTDQLKRNLFVDPGLTRSLVERDGAQIVTDGKRGLQLRNETHWFIYSDPVTVPVDTKNEVKDNLLSAMQFINQHGGWNGVYLYSQMTPKQAYGPQTLVFRQYVEGYPIVPVKQDTFGVIQLVVQKGIVSLYERSMIIPDVSAMGKKEAILPGGAALDEMVAAYNKKERVARVFPGYRPEIQEKQVVLTPAWFVELWDGRYEVLE